MGSGLALACLFLSRSSGQPGVSPASFALDFFKGGSDGSFQPKKNITNEQTAKIIWELKLKAEKPGLQRG